jgi:hypothetical protein
VGGKGFDPKGIDGLSCHDSGGTKKTSGDGVHLEMGSTEA